MLPISDQECLELTKQYFEECMNTYFSEYKERAPYPTFELLKSKSRMGLYSVTHNIIKVNKKDHPSLEELRSTVFHECIHYILLAHLHHPKQEKVSWEIRSKQAYFRARRNHHGKEFIELMNKINEKEGEGYITIKYTMGMDEIHDKDIFVHSILMSDGSIGMFYTKKINSLDDKIIKEIEGILIWDRNKKSINKEKFVTAVEHKILMTNKKVFTKIPCLTNRTKRISWCYLTSLKGKISDEDYGVIINQFNQNKEIELL